MTLTEAFVAGFAGGRAAICYPNADPYLKGCIEKIFLIGSGTGQQLIIIFTQLVRVSERCCEEVKIRRCVVDALTAEIEYTDFPGGIQLSLRDGRCIRLLPAGSSTTVTQENLHRFVEGQAIIEDFARGYRYQGSIAAASLCRRDGSTTISLLFGWFGCLNKGRDWEMSSMRGYSVHLREYELVEAPDGVLLFARDREVGREVLLLPPNHERCLDGNPVKGLNARILR